MDHYRSTCTLTFEHFKYYLNHEVFASLPKTLQLTEIRNFIKKIDELCWLVCRKNYIIENARSSVYTDENIYKLFRIFCLLADLIQSENENSPTEVVLHSSEMVMIVKQFMISLGLEYEEENFFNELKSSDCNYKFDEFLKLIEFKEYNGLAYEASLNEAVGEMFMTYIEDVLKKGFLYRRGYLLPTLREYWFVLQPCALSYYKNSTEHVLCGTIHLDSKCVVKPCSPTSGKIEKFQRFILTSGDHSFELATQDHRSRMQWIAALQLAITYSAGKEGYQRDLCSRRRIHREIEKNRKQDEEKKKTFQKLEAESFKKQLEKEKLARLAAENAARKFEEVAREDSRRVAELEDMKITLEKLLEEESQAKRDEEIVRALQARVLSEEWEKREELERLQEEQRADLELERRKREEFESKQKEKEFELKNAEVKLKVLEEERQKLDFELKQARNKILHSEKTKEFLEAQLNVSIYQTNFGVII